MVQKSVELGALGMVAIALGVVAYLAVQGSEQSQGALISVVSAGVGYFLRGRVETPTTTGTGGSGSVTVTPSVTVTGQPPSE